jgi:glycosyltransferase involved in cell wall biosynthesis
MGDSPKTKRLCLVCEAYAGGVRKHVRELLLHFARPQEGCAVFAVLGDRGEAGLTEEEAHLKSAGVRIVHLPEMGRELRPAQDWNAYRALKKQLKIIRPDIVHTHSAKAGFLGRLAATAEGVPLILHTPHVFPFQWAQGLRRRFYLQLERFAARRCAKLICVGEDQRAEALQMGAAEPEKLIVIRNGVAPPPLPGPKLRAQLRAQLQLPPQAPVVALVARLAPQKGLNLFVDAAAELAKRLPETIFLLIGDGPLAETIRTGAAAAGLDEAHFRMLGWRADAETLYPAFDALALTSLYEGLPYVLLEAQAFGLPVVVTDVPGSREAVADGETGFLVPPRRDAAALLAERLALLLSDAELRKKFGSAARERAAKLFPANAFFEAHRKLYAGATERR